MLAVENITKRFPGVVALNQVCMELYPGKVNAILGENGAGKSTLMKILSGVYCEYEGKILLKGKEVKFSSIKEAQACGIAIIHQELNLIPYLSIWENIFLGRELMNNWGLLDKKGMRQQTKELLHRLKLSLHPDTLIADLKVGQQQVVEIAKALLTDAEVIIMDEPTSAISDKEVEVLFSIITDLKKANKTIAYISHKLDELFKIADHYVVLRDGRSIESGNMQGITHDQLIQKMVGREIKMLRKQGTDKSVRPEALRLENIRVKHPVKKGEWLLKDISFQVGKGEIVGIFGLMGAGRTELLETIFGLYNGYASGCLFVEGKPVPLSSPKEAIKAGLALVPEDRKKDGLVLGLNVRKNISLTTLDDLLSSGLLSEKKEARLAEKYIGDLKIKAASDKQLAGNLSGGNQQKIVLAKWLAKGPKVLMLDEPTRGIDVGAKSEIYKLILQLADAGLGIIVVSSEMPELLAISDRILVLAEGSLTAEIPIDQADENTILKAAIPKTI